MVTGYTIPEEYEWDGEYCDLKAQRWKFNGSGPGLLTRTRQAKTLYELRTGGKSELHDPRLIVITCALYGHRNPFWPEAEPNDDWYQIPASEIELTGLGRLNSDGTLYAALARNTRVKFEPWARGRERLTVNQLLASGHDMEVLNVATTPFDRHRTTVGVGELTGVRFNPVFNGSGAPYWTIVPPDGSGGSLSPGAPNNYGAQTDYTAASNHVDAVEVIATFPRPLPGYPVQLKRKFKVIEPSGVQANVRGQADLFTNLPRVGAGMQLDVFLLPKTVSFYRVEIMEPEQPSTGTDHFADGNAPPHGTAQGANKWHPVIYTNKVVDEFFDHAADAWGWPTGVSGTYTWPIDPVWRVGEGDTTNDDLPGWTAQIFTLSEDGTMRIDKLEHHVIRSPDEDRGIVQ